LQLAYFVLYFILFSVITLYDFVLSTIMIRDSIEMRAAAAAAAAAAAML
jgi:hypothetical protein